MHNDVRELKKSEICSEVFVVAPSQIEFISKTFGNAVAEAMNVRPLSGKISQIAHETLIKTLQQAKHFGE